MARREGPSNGETAAGERAPARRRRAFALLALALSLLFALGLLEGVLRLAPGVLSPRLGNHVYSKYGVFPGGMYFLEPVSRSTFLHTRFETGAYWNGYRWRHRTDELGFRNPEGLEQREILLLGDSLIYGHGVEAEQTAAEILRTELGWPVYNMGRQGDCIYQQYVLSRIYLERLAPRTVVLVVFGNDPHDLLSYRSAEELAERPEFEVFDYEAIAASLAELDGTSSPARAGLRYSLRTAALYDGISKELQRPSSQRLWARLMGQPKAPPRVRPKPQKSTRTILNDTKFSVVEGYYAQALADLDRRTRAQGTRLAVVFLDVGGILGPKSVKAQRKLATSLKTIARTHGIPFASTRGLWQDCDECFLPGDGHLTEEGNRRLAEFLAARVLRPVHLRRRR